MATKIEFEVSYSQLVVFTSELRQPYNDWTDQHVAQGFAWRPGSVSFRTVSQVGPHSVEIAVVDQTGAVCPDAIRALEVPFTVPTNGAIEIGSITQTVPLFLPAGLYLLRCEFLQPIVADDAQVRLIFAKAEAPRFAVVRADPELSINGELLTIAQPAPG